MIAQEPKSPAATASKPDVKDDLKSLSLAEVPKRLESSPDGLSQAEARRRLAEYGPNEIAEEKINPLLKFLTYFWGPIPWMIEVAVILSGVVQHWPDFFIILLLLVANATIGFWEEHQAGNAIAALKAQLAIKARVRRDGKWTTPAARELVPGDVIRLRLGRSVISAVVVHPPGDDGVQPSGQVVQGQVGAPVDPHRAEFGAYGFAKQPWPEARFDARTQGKSPVR